MAVTNQYPTPLVIGMTPPGESDGDDPRAEIRELLDRLALVHGEEWLDLDRELFAAVWGDVVLRDRLARFLIRDALREMVRARSRAQRATIIREYRAHERAAPLPTPVAPVPVAEGGDVLGHGRETAMTPKMEQVLRMQGEVIAVSPAGDFLRHQLAGGRAVGDCTGAEILSEARQALAKGRGQMIKGLWLLDLGKKLRTDETPAQAGMSDGDLAKLFRTAEYRARVLLARGGVA